MNDTSTFTTYVIVTSATKGTTRNTGTRYR